MKKKIILLGLIMGSILMAAGCSSSTGINPDKYVTLGQYKGLEAVKEATEVTAEEVEAQIYSVLQSSAMAEPVTDRTKAEDGDIVNIDYEGKMDGKAFDGGTQQGAEVVIGSGNLIDGFETGIIGKEVGDAFDLNLVFPDPYPNNTELAGKDAVFSVVLNSISENIVPELTDDFVKTLSDEVSTVAEYKELLEKQLVEQKEATAEEALSAELWQKAFSNATVSDELPEELIKQKTETMYTNAQSYATSYGIEFTDFLTSYMGLTEEQFAEEAKTYALDAAKESLVLSAIAKAEKMELSEQEILDAITEYTTLYGYESAEAFKEGNDMEAFNEYILKSKILEFLKENAVISEE